ncbi:GNAT family N-acetyltransferase [Clostridium sp.]|uniref:GNAT family N-acetyltransferase n=1 Tax=Clostridium sp. TaxID=1506 RepID=UPI003D6D2890
MGNLKYRLLSDVNLNSRFFDSLKEDYKEFVTWFNKKILTNASAYIFEDNDDIIGFLYLKEEVGPIKDVNPIIEGDKILKIGTMKIDAHGTKLGEKFIKKVLDNAIEKNISKIYVTVFDKHDSLIDLYKKYGFNEYGQKETSSGTEIVLLKNLNNIVEDILKIYPKFRISGVKKYVLSIYPKYHTKLFPDSILKGEEYDLIKDVAYTNSIHKIYACNMSVGQLQKGDIILVYRTNDGSGPAKFRSVITSVCVVEELMSKNEFNDFEEFYDYSNKYSIFDRNDLERCYNKDSCYVIKMTYNAILNKKVINNDLKEIMDVVPNYWGFFTLTDKEFAKILEKGEVYESFIIN